MSFELLIIFILDLLSNESPALPNQHLPLRNPPIYSKLLCQVRLLAHQQSRRRQQPPNSRSRTFFPNSAPKIRIREEKRKSLHPTTRRVQPYSLCLLPDLRACRSPPLHRRAELQQSREKILILSN